MDKIVKENNVVVIHQRFEVLCLVLFISGNENCRVLRELETDHVVKLFARDFCEIVLEISAANFNKSTTRDEYLGKH
jgi:hypothetical protein